MTTTATSSPKGNDERLADISLFRRLLLRPEIGALFGALLVYSIFSLAAPDIYPTLIGWARIMDPTATLAIMSVAVALLMIGGEFDLSAGVMTGSTGLIFSYLITSDCLNVAWLGLGAGQECFTFGLDVWSAMLISLAFALFVGFINGLLVVRTALPSFIVTLGSFFILRGVNVGITRLLTDAVRITNIDEAPGYAAARFLLNAEFKFLDVSFRTSLFWMVLITILATWMLQRTRVGSWIFAIGGDYNAARSVGVPAARVKIGLFMMTASAGWLVGIMTALRLRSTLASQGVGQEFFFIIAAVIGGCLLTGGDGSAIGAAIGALVFGMTRTGITFAGWETDWLFAFLGIMLLAAVFANNFVRVQARNMRMAQTRDRDDEVERLPSNAAGGTA
ncbi:MAG: ABC transporter permease [Chloroflexota bacterium]